MSWNFDKLPAHEHGKVRDYLRKDDLLALRNLHDAYHLSPYNYCCNQDGIRLHFQDAVDKGIIQ